MEIPSIKVHHDYITINFPNGKFTTSRRGYKSSGNIPQTAFSNIIKYLENSKGTLIDSINLMFTSNEINSIYPNWNVKDVFNFKVGDKVSIEYKKSIHYGEIKELKRGKAVIKFDGVFLGGNVLVPLSLLTLTK